MKSNTLVKIFLVIACLFINPAYAETATNHNLYQVNILVFEHPTPAGSGSTAEQWPIISEQFNLVNAIEPQLLSPDESQLQAESKRLAANNDYKILLSAAWIQQIPVNKHARPIHIQGENINGTITLNRTRYFDVGANLILTDFVSGEQRNFRLQEVRRMRSNELNYLDHPMFGMLIKIMPVK